MTKAVFTAEKVTKNTVRFKEDAEKKDIKVGTVYVPKTTLDDIGWTEGKHLVMTIAAVVNANNGVE